MSGSSVAAVVVSYNVRELLLECVASLDKARSAGVLSEIVVVDNASSDGSAEAVRASFPDVCIIDAPNRGYGAGANRGIDATASDYVLILNPDTVVPVETVRRLAAELDAQPHVATTAPRMRYPDGSLQPSRRRFPGHFTPIFESTIFERWWPSNPWALSYHMRDSDEARVQEVDWVVGACLMVRRSAIERAGAFDETFWMYCEETELCWRLRKHGWGVLYVPDVEIVHHEGASSSQDIPRRQLAFDRSRIELQRRLYCGKTAALVALGIRIGYLVQFLLETSKFVIGHRRDLRRQRMAFYGRLLVSSLRFEESRSDD